MNEFSSFKFRPYSSLENTSTPSNTDDYNVVIEKVEVGDPGIAFMLSLKPKSNVTHPKKIVWIDVTVRFTDTVTKSPYSFTTSIFKAKDVNDNPQSPANSLPINLNQPFPIIMPFEDKTYKSGESFPITIEIRLIFTDGTIYQMPSNSQMSKTIAGKNQRFTYGTSGNKSDPTAINRPKGKGQIAVQQVKVANNAIGLTVDWSEDLDGKIHAFTLFACRDKGPSNYQGQSMFQVGNIPGNTFKHRPVEAILPLPVAENNIAGSTFDYCIYLEYIYDVNNQLIQGLTVSGQNQNVSFEGTTEMMTYSL